MSNPDEMKHRIELLKMARELLNEEYINRRAEDHNRWLAECDVAWKMKNIKLPYPPFAPYPTEAEIVAKAVSLFNFVKPQEPTPAQAPTVDPAPTSAPEEIILPPVADSTFLSKKEIEAVSQTKFIPQPKLPQETPWEKYLIPKPESEVAPTPITTVPSLDTPWEQILTPKLETINSTIQQSIEVSQVDTISETKLTDDPVVVNESTQSIPSTSGIKNLLPSWLQRNQTTKGSA